MLKYIFFIICQETHKTGWKKVLVTKKNETEKKTVLRNEKKLLK